MPKATTQRDTVIKAAIKDSSELGRDEYVGVKKGQGLAFYELDYDIHDHAEVKLAGRIGPFNEGDEVFIYTPHWNLPKSLKETKAELPVEHFDQVDNETGYHGPGNRQCCLTSHAMLICHLFPDFKDQSRANGHKEPEGYYGKLLYPYGDTTDHNAHTRLLAEHFGIKSYWSTTLSPKDIRRSLQKDIPVVTGHIYKSSGHITLTVGDLGEKGWAINDPYGARAGAEDYYVTIGHHAGDHDVYSNACLERIFWEQKVTNDPETGWGRILTTINGKSTGLPNGL